MTTELAKATISLAVAAGTYILDVIATSIEGVPNWVSELGLPVAFLVAVIYALISTNKALRASEAGRLQDRDEFMRRITDDATKSAESRERLRIATERQTAAFEGLAEELRKRPCQLKGQ